MKIVEKPRRALCFVTGLGRQLVTVSSIEFACLLGYSASRASLRLRQKLCCRTRPPTTNPIQSARCRPCRRPRLECTCGGPRVLFNECAGDGAGSNRLKAVAANFPVGDHCPVCPSLTRNYRTRVAAELRDACCERSSRIRNMLLRHTSCRETNGVVERVIGSTARHGFNQTNRLCLNLSTIPQLDSELRSARQVRLSIDFLQYLKRVSAVQSPRLYREHAKTMLHQIPASAVREP